MELPAHFVAPLCPLPDQELKEGGEAWLECVVSPPNAKVLWFKDGEEIQIEAGGGKYAAVRHADNGGVVRLRINDLAFTDTGTYSAVCSEEESALDLVIQVRLRHLVQLSDSR